MSNRIVSITFRIHPSLDPVFAEVEYLAGGSEMVQMYFTRPNFEQNKEFLARFVQEMLDADGCPVYCRVVDRHKETILKRGE